MLDGRGKLPGSNIVCPLHRWTYTRGQAARRAAFPDNPCLDLHEPAAAELERPAVRRQARRGTRPGRPAACAELDFSGYMLDRVQVHDYACNWKTFIEVYLEDYHVVPFHPGLGQFRHLRRPALGIRRLVSRADGGRQQARSAKPGIAGLPALARAGAALTAGRAAAARRDLAHAITRTSWSSGIRTCWWSRTLHPARPAKPAPTWSSSTIPRTSRCSSANSSRPSRRPITKPRSRTRRSACAWTRGRKALLQQGISETGPYQSPMEDGMMHFHEFLRREIAPHA